MRSIITALFLLSMSLGTAAHAQLRADSLSPAQAQAVKVFLDCGSCDINFIRTEIPFVNYVRDRLEADVHILQTSLSTAAGREYTITFIGQNGWQGQHDTLTYTANNSDSDDMVRSKLVHHLKMGLVRYVARTPLAKDLRISFDAPPMGHEVADAWNYWTFSTSVTTNVSGEVSSRYLYLNSGVTARRITKDLKIQLSLRSTYLENLYRYEVMTDSATEAVEITSISRGKDINGLVVASVDEHWSVGGFISATSSTYSNLQLRGNISPAVEYDLFPYSESTRKQLRFLYRVGYSYADYYEETIFDKKSESLWGHALTIALDLKQAWGSTGISVQGSQYFHDLTKRNLSLLASVSLRLFEGFSLNIFGSYSRVNDQLSLRKGTASAEEVLLQQRQLATSYSYYTFIGISYTFGSIFNNIVNPRFGDSGGGFSFSFSSE